ncbi:MAG: hypothetical protein ACE5GX_12990 [Thermoanaerobaculia bacterium]
MGTFIYLDACGRLVRNPGLRERAGRLRRLGETFQQVLGLWGVPRNKERLRGLFAYHGIAEYVAQLEVLDADSLLDEAS